MSFSTERRKQNAKRCDLVQNHVKSFNFLFANEATGSPGCLDKVIEYLPTYEIDSPYIENGPVWKFKMTKIDVQMPTKSGQSHGDNRLYPAECRQRKISYAAPLYATLQWECTDVVNGETNSQQFDINFGDMPIMLQSDKCHLKGMSEDDLYAVHEEPNELGGYFIANGNERVIRQIIEQRRNQLFCVRRSTFRVRHDKYSDLGLLIRCVRDDESIAANIVHYVTDGTATVEFTIGSAIFLIPVILLLRALKPTTDREIYNGIMQGTEKEEKNLFLSERVELMLQTSKQLPCRTQKECLAFIGEKFRRYYQYMSQYASAERIGQEVMERSIFTHCKTYEDKFNLLTLAIRKLYALVEDKIAPQQIDGATDCHEVVTSGAVLASVIRLGLEQYMLAVKNNCRRFFQDMSKDQDNIDYLHSNQFEPLMNPQKIMNGQIAERCGYFLNTGNLPYNDRSWKQKAGWAITADRINYFRFLSHFRAVHRGAFWAEMRSTDVRKLRPECWGFLCPVHTPDGHPCGLLNHMAEPCSIITHYYFDKNTRQQFTNTLLTIGLCPLDAFNGTIKNAVPVQLDGSVLGYVAREIAADFVFNLRRFKVEDKHGIPNTLSIAAVLDYDLKMWPEITLSSAPGRMVRPVQYLKLKQPVIEWVTPMEQVHLNISVTEKEMNAATTHLEINAQSILSVLAGMTPFSDNNQSPRNMYQCQMLKQAMGLFAMNMDYRSDNKAYRLQNVQSPITQNDSYKKYDLDDYACGTNAVVAVIAYTGYDMEDAMILCKQSMERGFKHGYVYATKILDLTDKQTQLGELHLHLRNVHETDGSLYDDKYDRNGLPKVGMILNKGDTLYILYNDLDQSFKKMAYKKAETCTVEQVRILKTRANESNIHEPLMVTLKLRYCRYPIIGDKFASRAGQKGTMSQLWPEEDMPFTEDGLTPDLIINPHAFPSRMTIGMLLESMASKAGSLNGEFYDSTPFKFDEEDRAVDFFGEKLLKNGYSYYGAESMYCGTTGVAMKAHIYIGLVYYQRLRHMISDKYQVRAMGPCNNLTKQPLKGRKRGGGIRLGEMERDSIISHGCAYLLHDRLFHCSDGELRWMCKKCGSFMSVYDNPRMAQSGSKWCRLCNSNDNLTRINVPHVLSYLSNELAAMNVKLTLKTEDLFRHDGGSRHRIAIK